MTTPAPDSDRAQKTAERIVLDFATFSLPARLFDTRIAKKFFERLPQVVDLIAWGDELYGTINADLGSDYPRPDIPAGGLAYSSRGSYFCIFFGQAPAWPVDFIGMIDGDGWKRLREEQVFSVTINPQPLRFRVETKGATFPGPE